MVRRSETAIPARTHPSNDQDLGAIGDILGFHIRLAHGAVYRHFSETFTEIDLTQKQVSVLWLIADHAGIAQTDLAQHMRMDRATTMAIVNRMQERGYLLRGKSVADKRKQTLHLTEAGQRVLEQAKKAVLQHEQWLKGRFTEQEVADLIEMLSRIHE